MNWEHWLLSRLLIILPEISWDEVVVKQLIDRGVLPRYYYELGQDLTAEWTKITRLAGMPMIQRIMAIAPEMMSVETVNYLFGLGLLSKSEAHGLRIGLAAVKNVIPANLSIKELLKRSDNLLDVMLSENMVNLLRDMDAARWNRLIAWSRTKPGAQWMAGKDSKTIREILVKAIRMTRKGKAGVGIGTAVFKSAKAARQASNAWNAVTIFWQGAISDETLAIAARLGVIPRGKMEAISAANKYGQNIWRKLGKSMADMPWQARALLIGEGVLSGDLVEALYANKMITKRVRALMQFGATAVRELNRREAAAYTKVARMRLTPGENPLSTFLRKTESSDRMLLRILLKTRSEIGQKSKFFDLTEKVLLKNQSDAYLLALLNKAQKEAGQQALALRGTGKIGAKIRGAQLELTRSELRDSIRRLYETSGMLILRGEKQAAAAAGEAMNLLMSPAWPRMHQDKKKMLEQSARSGIESFVSRQENIQPLSKLLWKNENRINEAIDRTLLKSLTAKEMAAELDQHLRMGGTYELMRVARTEINNAFHYSTVRYTREMPWVEGYIWHLSGRHGKPDLCDDYADEGFFEKDNVPGKPHPHCLCYITPETVSNGEFEKRMRSGAYENYFRGIEEAGFFRTEWDQALTSNFDRFKSMFGGGGAFRDAAVGTLFGVAIGDRNTLNILRRGTSWAANRAGEQIARGVLWTIKNPAEAKKKAYDAVSAARGFVSRMADGASKVISDKTALAKTWMSDKKYREILGSLVGIKPDKTGDATPKGWLGSIFLGDYEDLYQSKVNTFNSPQMWAHEMYTGPMYSAINPLLRISGGDPSRFGKLIASLMGGDDWDHIMKFELEQGAIRRDGGTPQTFTQAAGFPLRKRVEDLLRQGGSKFLERDTDRALQFLDSLATIPRTNVGWNFSSVDAFKKAFWDQDGDDGWGKPEWMKVPTSAKTISEYIEQGFKNLAANDAFKENRLLYRMSGPEWHGGGDLQKGLKFIADSFVSTEMRPLYYRGDGVIGGLSSTDRAYSYRIFVPGASGGYYPFGVGNYGEIEAILPPDSMFQVLDWLEDAVSNRTFVDVLWLGVDGWK